MKLSGISSTNESVNFISNSPSPSERDGVRLKKRNFLALSSISILLLTIFSCTSTTTQTETKSETVVDSTQVSVDTISNARTKANDSLQVFVDFYNSLVKADWTTANTIINEDGCWVLYSDGAMPQFKKVYKLQDFKNGANKILNELRALKSITTISNEALPQKNCDTKSGYTKEGLFIQGVSNLVTEHIWDNADMNEKERQEVAAIAATSSLTFINTDSYKFYFAQVNGVYKLIFIDVRKPCNA